MAIVRVQHIQAALSGQIEDATVNTWYFDTGGGTNAPGTATLGFIGSALDDFYNLAVGAGSAVRFFMAEATMSADQNSYKMFNMDDPTPRAPLAAPGAQNLTPKITTTPLPSEVACCLSFRGSLLSGTAPARRRGRVYIGPLNTAASALEVLTGHVRPSQALQTALTAGANRLKDSLAANLIVWGVYSPTQRAGGTASSGFTPITDAWVDNAFDTQRRRGIKPSARTTLAL